jgi:glycine cleavage system aminomethyltransferase T
MNGVNAAARTPLDDWHVTHAARMTQEEGWLIAESYAPVEDELAVIRSGLALADLSAFAKISLLGAGVETAARLLIGDDSPLIPLRVARFNAFGSGMACRLTEDHLLVLPEAINAAGLVERLDTARAGTSIIRHDVTSAFAGFGLTGPGIASILASLTALDPSALAPGFCAETNLAGMHALFVRPPEVNQLQIYVAWDLGEYAWERLLESGRAVGVTAVGSAAWKTIKRS